MTDDPLISIEKLAFAETIEWTDSPTWLKDLDTMIDDACKTASEMWNMKITKANIDNFMIVPSAMPALDGKKRSAVSFVILKPKE